ncbi:Eco57I restriction-modification methylase domain-containing protein [Helicobacter sp. MIT 01-3238]|uniref:type IIG restriction enzyme/methyltransferase n=1 Tax=Helicobacter sp. MIT 01-3238 TaxID=398627 RepID=UPI0021627200|nr:Eco57I restriction-modification methylase domain-containing protein [Helicobacter sp. MIT 01-3238]
MIYKHIALDEFIKGGGQYRDLVPSEDLSEFASAIATMTKEAQKDDSEEFQKNVIAQFLSTTFDYVCNTRGKVDLAIYDDEIPKVLFEVKATGNKAEFVKTPDSSLRGVANAEAIQNESVDCHESHRDSRNDKWGLESKALYESILYYLREWHKHKNNDIKHIILCTAKEFYIIKATDYHRLFAKNKDIERAYNNCDFNQGNDTSTAQFYKQVEAIIKDIEGQVEFYYINVESALNNQNDLALFYALLSPSVLLQIPRYIDANTLNERFYKELLYILGLVQVEQNGKALILPSTTQNTLLYSIKRDFADKLPRESSQDSSDSNALDSRQNALDLSDLAQSHKGESTQNPNHPHKNSHDSTDIFDSHIFPLIMLWNNRILFLRLLESMLLSFRHIDKPFLDISILRDFGALNTLFFKVLAVKNRADIPPNLANIPYLNSSLFEKSALESQGFEIATLQSKPLKIAPDSILRRDKTLRERYIDKDDSLPLLEYLFAFLHAYDFTTTPSDVQNYAKTNHDKLINSAVLGLVFEKLNGYKEGSFYTPSFITRYMCESSIRKIVVEKFNSANPQWQCKTLADIEYEIHREIRQARNTPDLSLRGSGDSYNKASVRSTDPHLQIQSYCHSEGAKRPKNLRIKSEFLDSSPTAQNDKSFVDCHDLKSPLPCGGDLGVGKSTQRADSRNDGFVSDSHNDSTKEILSKYNKIFLSIRICDPAVGSGHFLVSALNELIAIKSELGLLLDCEGRRLSDIDLVLENDELLIKDSLGNALDYRIPAHEGIEAHKIQKAIFYTKKELIENCLFGVDINPNSVEICKLRLWIELLKYSYYENIATKELQTLPNIDINIKCGNSLVSNIALNISKEKLEAQLKSLLDKDRKLGESNEEANEIKAILHDLKVKLPEQIESYKKATNAYKNETNRDLKTIHKNNIESAKDFILSLFVKTNPQYREFKSIFAKYLKTYGYGGIDNIKVPKQNQQELEKWCNKLNTYLIDFNYHKTLDIPKQKTGLVYDEFLALVKSMNAYELIKTQAREYFEWRFEFPEVLNAEGDFMGFDLIIGNPPYIRQEEIKELKPHLQKSFSIYCGTGDIYTYFYERGHSLLKAKGILTLITSNKFCRAGYGANLRAFLLQSVILDFVDLNGVKVFDKATVDTCIVNLSKQKPTKSHALNYANPNAKDLSTISYSQIPQDSLSSEAFIFVDLPTLALKQKIEQIGTPLKEWDIEINYGIKTGYNEAFIIDTATRDRILADCDDSDKSRKPFLASGDSESSPSLARGNSKDSPSLAEGARGWVNLTEKERTAQIIKPILRGRDIKRYSYEWANLWLIFLS